MFLIGCEESLSYRQFYGIEKLFVGPNEKSNLEYLSLFGADIQVQKHLDDIIEHFIADHPKLKEVDLSISLKDGRLGADDEWAFLESKSGIRGCSVL